MKTFSFVADFENKIIHLQAYVEINEIGRFLGSFQKQTISSVLFFQNKEFLANCSQIHDNMVLMCQKIKNFPVLKPELKSNFTKCTHTPFHYGSGDCSSGKFPLK